MSLLLSAVREVRTNVDRSKKIDLHVFPMLCIVFGLSLLDRANISTAYIAGMGQSLDLAVGSRYSIALLAFFPGYTIFELPSNAIIRRLGCVPGSF